MKLSYTTPDEGEARDWADRLNASLFETAGPPLERYAAEADASGGWCVVQYVAIPAEPTGWYRACRLCLFWVA